LEDVLSVELELREVVEGLLLDGDGVLDLLGKEVAGVILFDRVFEAVRVCVVDTLIKISAGL